MILKFIKDFFKPITYLEHWMNELKWVGSKIEMKKIILDHLNFYLYYKFYRILFIADVLSNDMDDIF